MATSNCDNLADLIQLAQRKQIVLPRNPKKRDLCTLLNQIEEGKDVENQERLKKRFIEEKQKEDAKPFNIVKQYLIKLRNRAKDDDKWKELGESKVIQKFIETDPTENKSYLEWIVRSYIDNGIQRIEDLSRTKNALKAFITLQPRLSVKERQIDSHCGIAGCDKNSLKLGGLEDLIDKYQNSSAVVEKKGRQIEIENVTETVKDEDFEELFNGNTLRLVQPKTKAAACYYGQGTRWCTAATEGENLFDDYNRKGELVIVIPKTPQYVGEKYQLHCKKKQYMDEKDLSITLKELFQKYPELSKTEVNAYRIMQGKEEDESVKLIRPLNLRKEFCGYFIPLYDAKVAATKKDVESVLKFFNDAAIPVHRKIDLYNSIFQGGYGANQKLVSVIKKQLDQKLLLEMAIADIKNDDKDHLANVFYDVLKSISRETFSAIAIDDLENVLHKISLKEHSAAEISANLDYVLNNVTENQILQILQTDFDKTLDKGYVTLISHLLNYYENGAEITDQFNMVKDKWIKLFNEADDQFRIAFQKAYKERGVDDDMSYDLSDEEEEEEEESDDENSE